MPKKLFFTKKRSILLIVFCLLFVINCLFLSPKPAASAPGDPPNPQPCKNAINDQDKLTDNYITGENGDPPISFKVTGQGTPGTSIPPATILGTLSPQSKDFTVDFSQLQAIFGSQNSNYLEGNFQDQAHQSINLINTQRADFNSYHGPGQKSAPIVLTDQLRTKYVTYVYNKPELPESANKYSDINGANPKTIHDMVKTPFPFPPNPPSMGGDKTIWNSTWGMYWEKIPTAYSEFYLGKLEFRATVGLETINQVKTARNKDGDFAPMCPIPLRTIEFVMPDFFRATATSGELNQIIVPNAAQSKDSNNVILSFADNTKSAFSSFIQKCVNLATKNPLSKKLHKVVSELIKDANPVKDVYAVNRATNLSTNQTGCGSTGKVSAILSWTRADDPSGGLPLQDQEMEISLNSSFSSGVTQTISLTASQSSRTFTDFFTPNTDYWWRVHSQYFGVWSTGDNVASFHSNTCPTPTPPGCTFSPGSVIAGSNITVTSQGGLTGQINMQGAFGGTVTNLGTLTVPSTSVTIPAITASGTYVIRVGAFAVTCKTSGGGDLQVTGITLPPSCSFTGSNPAANGASISVTYQGTIAGNQIVLASRLSGAVLQTFGSTQDSQTASKTATYTISAPGGGYTILIQTPGPITTNVANCGNIDVTAPTPACVFSPTTLNVGDSLGIITNNFPAGSLNVQIAGRTFGNVVALGTIPSTGGGVTIPVLTPAPQQYDVQVNSGSGTFTTCTGILTVNIVVALPACVFSPTTIAAGGAVGIITNNFTINPIPVNLVGTVFGNVVSVGTIPQTGGSITIPAGIAGTYEVRLGNTGATTTCAGILTVSVAAPACVFSPTTINAGGTVGIITNNFTIDPIPVNLVGTVFGNVISVGTIPKTGGAITIPTGTAGIYEVRLGISGATTTCTGTLTINAPVAACVFAPTTLGLGDSLGIIVNNFPAGSLNVKIAGRTFGNVVQLGSIPSTGGAVTIPIVTPAPQQYDVLVGPPAGPDTTCTGILQVNQVGGNVATDLAISQTGCQNGKVSITFTWTPALNFQPGNIAPTAQWLDYALVPDITAIIQSDPNQTSGYWGNRLVNGLSTTTFTGFFAKNTDYWWRINTDWGPFLGGWAPSVVSPFHTIDCPGGVTFAPLSPDSCIRNPQSSKDSTAPYCALPLNNSAGQPQLLPGESCTDKNDSNKLDTTNTNVVCTFKITWTTNQSFYIPKDGEDLGPWDSCSGDNTQKSCTATIAVWPDFRIPLLAETWNNTLYSEADISTNSNQESGRPGVYSYFTPKGAEQALATDPIQVMIDKCTADPSMTGGCKDLSNFASTHAKDYPGFETCVNNALFDPAKLIACFDLVARGIAVKTLPGDVNNKTTTEVKQRFIGATDCFKGFVRDMALKPLELQKALKIEQGCKATSSP